MEKMSLKQIKETLYKFDFVKNTAEELKEFREDFHFKCALLAIYIKALCDCGIIDLSYFDNDTFKLVKEWLIYDEESNI